MKRYFSLLEVLISLTLASLLFSFLLVGYFGAHYAAIQVVKEEKDKFPEKYLLHRLSEVFLALSADVDQSKQFFYTFDLSDSLGNTPALLFSYDNGMVLSPPLSGNVLGLLFLDQEGNVTFITLPSRANWVDDRPTKMHREVLWTNVAFIHFDFFLVPENLGEKGKTPYWLKGTWPKDLKGIPAALDMSLTTQDNRQLSFLFPVPSQLAVLREKK